MVTAPKDFHPFGAEEPLKMVRTIPRYRLELGTWRGAGEPRPINHRQDTPASDLLRSKFLESAGVYQMGLIN